MLRSWIVQLCIVVFLWIVLTMFKNRFKNIWPRRLKKLDVLCIFLIIAIIVGGVFLFSHLELGIDLEAIGNFLSNYGLIILIITTMVMLYISYKISCKIYCKKSE